MSFYKLTASVYCLYSHGQALSWQVSINLSTLHHANTQYVVFSWTSKRAWAQVCCHQPTLPLFLCSHWPYTQSLLHTPDLWGTPRRKVLQAGSSGTTVRALQRTHIQSSLIFIWWGFYAPSRGLASKLVPERHHKNRVHASTGTDPSCPPAHCSFLLLSLLWWFFLFTAPFWLDFHSLPASRQLRASPPLGKFLFMAVSPSHNLLYGFPLLVKVREIPRSSLPGCCGMELKALINNCLN